MFFLLLSINSKCVCFACALIPRESVVVVVTLQPLNRHCSMSRQNASISLCAGPPIQTPPPLNTAILFSVTVMKH